MPRLWLRPRNAPPLTLNGWLRFDIVSRLLASLHSVESILEIGAGEGAVGWRLARRYRYVGLEPDAASFAKARIRLDAMPSARVLNQVVEALPAGETFDLVCAFEVLEHIEDDQGALREWKERVRPGGWLLLSVPAWPSRWGALDVKAGHYRRYEPGRMEQLLRDAGFVEPASVLYGFPLTYLLQPLWNLAARPMLKRGGSMADKTAASGRWLQPPDAAGLATQLISAPFRLLQRPFAHRLGTGLICLARRPGNGGAGVRAPNERSGGGPASAPSAGAPEPSKSARQRRPQDPLGSACGAGLVAAELARERTILDQPLERRDEGMGRRGNEQAVALPAPSWRRRDGIRAGRLLGGGSGRPVEAADRLSYELGR